MRFGKTLLESSHPPWKDKYIDYGKLKGMLRESDDDENEPWTEEDENRFCDEIFNVQLEKVARFQEEEVKRLRARVDAAFEMLKVLVPTEDGDEGEDEDKKENETGKNTKASSSSNATANLDESTAQRLTDLEGELDAVTNKVKQLMKYSSLNYTGFLKIVKKHDRKRGDRYKIRPMMQLSLAKRPFNSERGYSSLLNKLSLLYFAIRQHRENDGAGNAVIVAEAGVQSEIRNGETYTAHKFWVHPDNLLEVKTYILRRLPALIYSQQSAKELDGNADPTITSLYFDNPKFDLSSKKGDGEDGAAALRLRWYGQLSEKPEIVLEQKIVQGNGSSEERKITIKEKYVKPFLDGEYKLEKTTQKMERQGRSAEDVQELKATADHLQAFICESKLEPVLRANYIRTAFQNPGDTRVRISIDSELAFIREDTLDRDRPCRDPGSWHRTDMDNSNMSYPFKNINQREVSRFPYAVLEVKLKEDSNRKRPAWIEDLMTSHLVHPVPRFSKFVHGVASLFEDYVNRLPFWLSDLEGDIRKDPQVAFEKEEQRRAELAESEQVVGSFLGTKVGSIKASRSSPVSKSYLAERLGSDHTDDSSPALRGSNSRPGTEPSIVLGEEDGADDDNDGHEGRRKYGTLSFVFPSFSLSRYSKARAARCQRQQLPTGVVEPPQWIKNAGPLQVEPKVWLANERTFLKWQHICVLMGGLAVSLYSAAGQNLIAEIMGVMYLAIAAFAGIWGYFMLRTRQDMIVQRSGKDLNNMFGPTAVSFALIVALLLNFALAYKAALERMGVTDDAQQKIGNSSAMIVGEL